MNIFQGYDGDQMYRHRNLSDKEKADFEELYLESANHNPLVRKFLQNKLYTAVFPIIIAGLLLLSYQMHFNKIFTVIAVVMGLVSIQLNFVVSHMWAHALMLEYDLWNRENMLKHVGEIPFVLFYAFYHHHHTDEDDWSHVVSTNNFHGAFATAFAHWESFSLFTMRYPLNESMRWFVISSLYWHPYLAPFFLGYEIGVILLPISHDWVHKKNAQKFGIYYILKALEMIGIFAKPSDHAKHHKYTHPTVYQGFTSSGLYSARFDAFLDNIWNYFFYHCHRTKSKLHSILWYLMIATTCGTLLVSTVILRSLHG